jgi:hypothetical protein
MLLIVASLIDDAKVIIYDPTLAKIVMYSFIVLATVITVNREY